MIVILKYPTNVCILKNYIYMSDFVQSYSLLRSEEIFVRKDCLMTSVSYVHYSLAKSPTNKYLPVYKTGSGGIDEERFVDLNYEIPIFQEEVVRWIEVPLSELKFL